MKIKKFIPALIISSALIAAILILTNNNKTDQEPLAVQLETNNPFLAFNKQNLNAESKIALAAAAGQTTNLTEAFAKLYFQELVKQNPENFQADQRGLKLPKDISDINLNQDEIAELINQTFKIIPFEIKDIKISQDGSVSAQLAYINALQTINQKNFSQIKDNIVDIVEQWIFYQKKEKLAAYVRAVPNQIKDLLILPVPPAWQEFHLQNLNLWQKKLAAYSALLDIEQDPLKSLPAIQEISLIIQEGLKLDETLQSKYLVLNKIP